MSAAYEIGDTVFVRTRPGGRRHLRATVLDIEEKPYGQKLHLQGGLMIPAHHVTKESE